MDSSVKVDASVKTIPPAILHLDIVRVYLDSMEYFATKVL